MSKKCHHLIIDDEFKALSPIYSKEDYTKTEVNLVLLESASWI